MEQYLHIIHIISMLSGVPENVLHGVCKTESNGNASAYVQHDGGSPSFGLCQIKYKTAKHMGFKGKPKELFDPYVNMFYAAKYLSYQHERYQNWNKAISAYNAGRYIKSNKKYVTKVLSCL
jgi:soluble lytic murein transglycosylase-like protein